MINHKLASRLREIADEFPYLDMPLPDVKARILYEAADVLDGGSRKYEETVPSGEVPVFDFTKTHQIMAEKGIPDEEPESEFEFLHPGKYRK